MDTVFVLDNVVEGVKVVKDGVNEAVVNERLNVFVAEIDTEDSVCEIENEEVGDREREYVLVSEKEHDGVGLTECVKVVLADADVNEEETENVHVGVFVVVSLFVIVSENVDVIDLVCDRDSEKEYDGVNESEDRVCVSECETERDNDSVGETVDNDAEVDLLSDVDKDNVILGDVVEVDDKDNVLECVSEKECVNVVADKDTVELTECVKVALADADAEREDSVSEHDNDGESDHVCDDGVVESVNERVLETENDDVLVEDMLRETDLLERDRDVVNDGVSDKLIEPVLDELVVDDDVNE
jgi:hypothetical protein